MAMLDNTTHTDWCLLTFSAAPDFIALWHGCHRPPIWTIVPSV